MENLNKQSGAYILRFVNLGLLYVGSTDNFARRKIEHLGMLSKGTHYKSLQQAYREDKNVIFEFFPISDREEAFYKEQELITLYSQSGRLLNRVLSVQFRTEETNLKISSSLMGHEVSSDCRRKLGESKKGNKFWVGKTHSEESRRKISEANKGNSYAKGHSKTPEGIEKIRQTHLGRKLSDNTKLLVSLNSAKSKQVSVNGILYRNITEAAKAENVSGDTIRRRCLSDDIRYWFTADQKAKIKKA